jgi:uncharacterized SAM-binding protein YcdF (DUF218 family)
MPLQYRFGFSPPVSQAPPNGIIVLGGSSVLGIEAAEALSRDYPEARIILSGYSATAVNKFARLGGDPARVYVESRPQTTFEDALYSAALLKPKPSERWLLVTSALHMPRAVGCFRAAGFQVQPYPLELGSPDLFVPYFTGPAAFYYLDLAAKEWIGLIAYRLMGRTEALFPGP